MNLRAPAPAGSYQITAVAVVLAVLYAGKHYYSGASAGELRFILAPTAKLVSLTSGANFVYEAGAGWVDRNVTFIIAPACAGINFALAAFLALTIGWLSAMRTWRSTAKRLVVAASLAYVATLVVNTLRIVIAIALHRGTLDVGDYDHAELHRIEGIVVYLGGLCGLYALARAFEKKEQGNAVAQ